jgi:hypothetical protein
MKRIATILLLLASPVLASADDAGRSRPVQGLRARLSVLASKDTNSPFCRVIIELQNVEAVLGQKKIRFTPDRLALRVSDKHGKVLSPVIREYDGVSPNWEPIALPYAGTIRFQISFPGLGYRPREDKVIVDVGPSRAWVIPQDGSTYFLAGRLSIEPEESGHPVMDWSGTLELPGVEIPKASRRGETEPKR